jgi:transposase
MSHKTAATAAHTIGIDTGKNTLHLIGLDDKGAIVLREKIARGRIAARLANVPRCLIGIEAGMATHYVAGLCSHKPQLRSRVEPQVA